jgi:PAS domain S-box-containing protein
MKRPVPTNNEIKMKQDDFIVSKTDKKGIITYGNEIFINMSGYTEKELIGTPHSILRHPDMPRIVFKLLWDRIQEKQEIFAYVKNLAKDGSFYWVFTNVTASLDSQGNIRDYYSVRRAPNPSAIATIEPVYKLLLDAEKEGGMEASGKLLNDFLKEKGVSYDKLILSLQQ